MKKLLLVLVVALALSMAAIVYLWPGQEITLACIVTGDVQQDIELSEMPKNAYVKIAGNGSGLPLEALVAASSPLSDNYSVYLEGTDGLFLQLKKDELAGCYIVKKGGNWIAMSSEGSVDSSLDSLSKIIIADESGDPSLGVHVISRAENLLHLTPGGVYRQQLTCYPYRVGELQLGEEHGVPLFRHKQVLSLATVTREEIDSVLVMGRDGEYECYTGSGYLEFDNREIHFLHPDAKLALQNIAGVIINPPALSVLDSYKDALHYLDSGERVLMIVIDGLSHRQYEQALEEDLVPQMAALGDAMRVNTVYKPTTNAGLAAIVTGQPPAVNGVGDGLERALKMQTIFDYLEERHKTHVLVEGSAETLYLNTEIIYSPDLYGVGSTDDDVFGNAAAQIEKDPDLLLVHFHGIDDAGHNYGPMAKETFKALAMVDVYIGLLVEEWSGRVIIVASHGMHSAGVRGDHGDFQFEDMFVPYILN